MTVTLEPMSAERYESWHHQQIVGYAEQKTQAGIWTEGEAMARATAETAAQLTDGLSTSGHDIFIGTADDEEVGFLWLFSDPQSAEHGVTAIRLNVFSFNTTAINLYESSGFVPTTMTMRKRIVAS